MKKTKLTNEDFLLSHILELFQDYETETDPVRIEFLKHKIFDSYSLVVNKSYLLYRILKEVVLSNDEKLNLLPLFFTQFEKGN